MKALSVESMIVLGQAHLMSTVYLSLEALHTGTLDPVTSNEVSKPLNFPYWDFPALELQGFPISEELRMQGPLLPYTQVKIQELNL